MEILVGSLKSLSSSSAQGFGDHPVRKSLNLHGKHAGLRLIASCEKFNFVWELSPNETRIV